MKTIRNLIAAATLAAMGTTAAMAQSTTFTNGNFATGTFAGWTTLGDVSLVGSQKRAALTTASVAYEDDHPNPAGFNNNSGTAAVDFAFAPDLAGVDFAKLDAINGTTYEGSAIRQNFIATAGDTLTIHFDWAFLSADTDFADFGFLAINDTVVKIVDTNSTPLASSFNGVFGDLNDVTWSWTGVDFTYTANSTGAVSLVIGVADVNDYNGTSELRVDNITVSAVPEPEAYALALAGLLVAGSLARRRA
jgi:hypothetical protein